MVFSLGSVGAHSRRPSHLGRSPGLLLDIEGRSFLHDPSSAGYFRKVVMARLHRLDETMLLLDESWRCRAPAAIRRAHPDVGQAFPSRGGSGDARDMSRTDSVSRVIRAGPERVFPALVEAEALARWLPPAGMSGRFERFEAVPGGTYRLVLMYDDDTRAAGKTTSSSEVVEARFVDIVPNVRVVQAVDFVSDDPAFAGTMTMTWELSAEGAATRVELRAEDVPAGISREEHETGMASSLANLAAFVEGTDLPQ